MPIKISPAARGQLADLRADDPALASAVDLLLGEIREGHEKGIPDGPDQRIRTIRPGGHALAAVVVWEPRAVAQIIAVERLFSASSD